MSDNVENLGVVEEEFDTSNAIEISNEQAVQEFKFPEKVCVFCGIRDEERVHYCTERYHLSPVLCCEDCVQDVIVTDENKIVGGRLTKEIRKVCPICAPKYRLKETKKLCEFFVEEQGNNVVCSNAGEIFRYEFDGKYGKGTQVLTKCMGNYKKCQMYRELKLGV